MKRNLQKYIVFEIYQKNHLQKATFQNVQKYPKIKVFNFFFFFKFEYFSRSYRKTEHNAKNFDVIDLEKK